MVSNNNAELAAHLGHLARAALVAEARLTPKPGLVDAQGNGAHTDMSIETFMASADALEDSFWAYAEAGLQATAHGGSTDAEALAIELRHVGVRAEQAMFAATDGVNTHKGANFSLALILGATGAYLSEGRCLPLQPAETELVLRNVAHMGRLLLDRDRQALRARMKQGDQHLTHGERVLCAHGMQGVRGEAAQGYPLVREVLLPYVREQAGAMGTGGAAGTGGEQRMCGSAGDAFARASASAGAPNTPGSTRGSAGALNTPGSTRGSARMPLLRTLVKTMSILEDTNVVHRGGEQALVEHRRFCKALDAANLDDDALIAALDDYDAELIEKNVSPGGAADLLSLTVFLALIEGVLTPESLAY